MEAPRGQLADPMRTGDTSQPQRASQSLKRQRVQGICPRKQRCLRCRACSKTPNDPKCTQAISPSPAKQGKWHRRAYPHPWRQKVQAPSTICEHVHLFALLLHSLCCAAANNHMSKQLVRLKLRHNTCHVVCAS